MYKQEPILIFESFTFNLKVVPDHIYIINEIAHFNNNNNNNIESFPMFAIVYEVMKLNPLIDLLLTRWLPKIENTTGKEIIINNLSFENKVSNQIPAIPGRGVDCLHFHCIDFKIYFYHDRVTCNIVTCKLCNWICNHCDSKLYVNTIAIDKFNFDICNDKEYKYCHSFSLFPNGEFKGNGTIKSNKD